MSGGAGIFNMAVTGSNKFTINLINSSPNLPLVGGETYTITLVQAIAGGKIQLNSSPLSSGIIATDEASVYSISTTGFGNNIGSSTLFMTGDTQLQLTFTTVVPNRFMSYCSASPSYWSVLPFTAMSRETGESTISFQDPKNDLRLHADRRRTGRNLRPSA